MKKLIPNTFQILIISLLLFSCSKNEVSQSDSRAIKYEITGDFTGKLTVVAATNTDPFEIMEVTKLPWKLEFEANKSLTTVVIAATGSGGITGQKASMKTYIGGKEVSSGGGTALSSGFLNMTNQVYILK
jgi:hypothetical protein